MADEQLTFGLGMHTSDDFRKVVALMRELGVTQAFGIVLGAEPQRDVNPGAAPTDAEIVAMLARDKQARDALLFASSEGFPPGFDDE